MKLKLRGDLVKVVTLSINGAKSLSMRVFVINIGGNARSEVGGDKTGDVRHSGTLKVRHGTSTWWKRVARGNVA